MPLITCRKDDRCPNVPILPSLEYGPCDSEDRELKEIPVSLDARNRNCLYSRHPRTLKILEACSKDALALAWK